MAEKARGQIMIILYSIDCPKCKILEKKLNNVGITYSVVKDRDIIRYKGMDLMPVLEVDGKRMGFKEAVDWVNARG